MANETISEEWRPINGYPGYEVSNLGRVRSLDRRVKVPANPHCGAHTRFGKGRVLVQSPTKKGYMQTNLGRDNGRLVHILVCEAFCGEKPSSDHIVAHWDGQVNNNVWTNLRWATYSENEADKIRHGVSQRGENNGAAILTAKEVIEIRHRRASGETLTTIGNAYGVHFGTISDIVTGKTWRHI